MIKFTVLYPNDASKNFDMDYYCTKHIPLVAGLLGDSVKGASVEKGIASGAPSDPAPFIATGNLYFESMASFESNFGANAPAIMADVPNFTTITPVVQISEVMI